MKAGEIRACDLCGEGLMSKGAVSFYQVTLRHLVIDIKALRERQGLATLLGGSAQLAEVFAPTGEIANQVVPASELIVCQDCGVWKQSCIALMLEDADKGAAKRAEAAAPPAAG